MNPPLTLSGGCAQYLSHAPYTVFCCQWLNFSYFAWIKCHFENVYKEPPAYRESDLSFVNDGKGNIIEMSDKVILNKELSIDELFNALKKSNNNSSPGSDGLPCEVYKFFWNQLKSPLLDCYKHSFEKGYLCSSQSQGIICLHHKGKGLSRIFQIYYDIKVLIHHCSCT